MRDSYDQKYALQCEKNCLLITPIILIESLFHGSRLRSPALPQVYLSLTFQLSQTAVVKIEMSSTFPTFRSSSANHSYNFSMVSKLLFLLMMMQVQKKIFRKQVLVQNLSNSHLLILGFSK